jgi:hypothetical protein
MTMRRLIFGAMLVVMVTAGCAEDGKPSRPPPILSPTGPCCAPTGICTVQPEETCTAPNTWQGPGGNCSPNPCVQPPRIVATSPNGASTFALDTSGRSWLLSADESGWVRDQSHNVPVSVDAIRFWTHNCFVTLNGDAWVYKADPAGWANFGHDGPSGIVATSPDGGSTLALDSSGRSWLLDPNETGWVRDQGYDIPLPADSIKFWTRTCFITHSGNAWVHKSEPAEWIDFGHVGPSRIVAASPDGSSTLALDREGRSWLLNANESGWIRDVVYDVPTPVDNIKFWTRTCFITLSGDAWVHRNEPAGWLNFGPCPGLFPIR